MDSRVWIVRAAVFLLGMVPCILTGYLVAGQEFADDLAQPIEKSSAKPKSATSAGNASGVWWYSIADGWGKLRGGSRRIIGDYGERLTVKKTDLGTCFLDVEDGRFVYHLFQDGNEARSVVGSPVEDRPLIGAALGFDGNVYWEALFSKRIDYSIFGMKGYRHSPSWWASEVKVYRSLKTRHPPKSFADRMWFERAPLHDLLAYIDCDSWDHASLANAFTASPYGAKVRDKDKVSLRVRSSNHFVGDGSFFKYHPWVTKEGLRDYGGGGRSYLVQLDDEMPAIKKCQVDYLGAGFGPGTALPLTHFLFRRGQLSEFPATMFSFQHYVDADTVIRHVDAVPLETEKDN